MLLPEEKKEVIKEFGRHENDVGSPEVQIALLTKRIKILEEHLKNHKHDYSAKRRLFILIARRRKLLEYLSRTNPERYQFVISKLGLRK
ncbi:MAG: 30S ribosomal protein S15 [Candidatus Calescibacterium sp.]|jgi:small subunit ribosomal protein S15